MGQITIIASGSMSTAKGGKDVRIDVPHAGTNDECFAKAHAALDKLKSDLREKLGDAGY